MRTGLVAAALLLAGGVSAQEPEAAPAPAPAAPAETAPAKPKPRPKPKPKPTAKSETGTGAASPDPGKPELRMGTHAAPRPDAPASPPAAPPPTAFLAPPVACDPGQSVLYDGPKDFSVWVTRIGSVTIENPLRPLTPDTTRVLLLVIGNKVATAYGRDLGSLRRGGAPAALESLLGGPVRWEAKLGSLPDSFEIVSDSGAALAQMRFKECGTAPAAKMPPAPVAKKEPKPKPARKPPASQNAGAPAAAPSGSGAPSQSSTPPRQFNMPQGALPE